MEPLKDSRIHIKSWRLIIAIIMVIALCILLKYLNLNTFVILFGFRCHISLILPFFLLFNTGFLPYIKRSFLNPEYKRPLIFLLLIILPVLIEGAFLFFSHNIDLGDPDYFYEFGVSSIVDFPIYFLWNLPQIVLLFFFLTAVSSVSKYRFIVVFIVILLLFGTDIIPWTNTPFPYSEAGILVFCSVIFSVLINYYRNIYWFSISLFTILRLPLLAFGSNSKTLVNLLFASQYKNWEGFFEVSKFYAPYSMPAYFLTAMIISLVMLIFRKRVINQN